MRSPTQDIIRVEPGTPVAPALRGAVAVMGNLDGVHRGHQFLIRKAAGLLRKDRAQAGDGSGETAGSKPETRLAETHQSQDTAKAEPFAAIIFDPHPRALFAKDTPPFLLTSIEQRTDLLCRFGIDHVFILPFSRDMAALSPDDFVGDILVKTLGIKSVVVGAEFQFGRGRIGTAETLLALGAQFGVGVTIVTPSVNTEAGEKYSSSQARSALRAGDPEEATRILGRPWSIRGKVERGRQLGRSLNFPTANISIGDLVMPQKGVYAVRLYIEDREYTGVANFGDRPTVDGENPLLEVHIFDFDTDIYDLEIEVYFHSFIREERKFDNLEALTAQIAKDCLKARAKLDASE